MKLNPNRTSKTKYGKPYRLNGLGVSRGWRSCLRWSFRLVHHPWVNFFLIERCLLTWRQRINSHVKISPNRTSKTKYEKSYLLASLRASRRWRSCFRRSFWLVSHSRVNLFLIVRSLKDVEIRTSIVANTLAKNGKQMQIRRTILAVEPLGVSGTVKFPLPVPSVRFLTVQKFSYHWEPGNVEL